MPEIKLDRIENLTFIEQIMKPHTPYYKAVKDLLTKDVIHGMAHITGGGIEGNISDEEMLRTFNCGAGFAMVVSQKEKAAVMKHIQKYYDCYEIGSIEKGNAKIIFENRLNWV